MSQKIKFTREQWSTLCIIGSVHFSSALCISIQAPFYPMEAESKNATATEYGLVFGVFELVSFIISPVYGNYIDVIGAKRLLNAGISTAAVCSILFGLLDLFKTLLPFISLSFLLRIIEALGASAAVTAAFATTAAVFPNSVATTFATLELFYGLGYIVGPTVGGALFSWGGYKMPFVVLGMILFIDGILIYLFLPDIPRQDSNENESSAKLIDVLKIPAVILNSFCITAASSSVGFYAATLEPHIRQFGLSPIATGFMFVISGGVYALTAPFIGRLCDTKVYPKTLVVVGSLCIITGCILVGPAPFIPLSTMLWMCILGLIFEGLGIACINVACFIDGIRSAVENGLPDDISTYGLISGLWASTFSLGAFIGPSVAGVLYDLVGFRNGTLFIFVVHLAVFVASSTYIILEKLKSGHYQMNNQKKTFYMSTMCPNTIENNKNVNKSSDYGTIS